MRSDFVTQKKTGEQNRSRNTLVIDAIDRLLSGRLNNSKPNDIVEECYNFGCRLSLLFFAFVLHVKERAEVDRLERLYFLTSEGEFFLKIYQQIQDNYPQSISFPDSTLLEVSRLSTFAGSLRTFSCTELMRLWNQYKIQSLSGLFSSLGIDSTPFVMKFQEHRLALQEPIQSPWLDHRVLSLFTDPGFLEPIENILTEKRRLLNSYLASKGLSGENSRIGIVDIGWRGTIQDNLAYVFPATQFHGYYLALNSFLNVQPANCVKDSYGPNLNLNRSSLDFLLDVVEPMEMLSTSPSGSVQGYELTESGIKALLRIDSSEKRVYEEYIYHFQRGVIESVAYWTNFSRTHAYTANELRPIALNLWIELIQKPCPYIAKALLELNHNEVFGAGVFSGKRKLPEMVTILKAVSPAKRNSIIDEFKSEVRWPQGFFANPDISSGYKIVIWVFILLNRFELLLYNKTKKFRKL